MADIKIDGISWNQNWVKSLKKEDFIKHPHPNHHYSHITDPAKRAEIIEKAFDIIVGKPEEKK